MLKVKTITYKRIHNLGNYNTEHLEMSAEIDIHDDELQCSQDLKEKVELALGLVKPEPKPAPVTAPANYDKKPF